MLTTETTPTDPRAALIAAAREQAAQLRPGFVDAKPEDFDFDSNRTDEDGDPAWDYIEAAECEECGNWIVDDTDHAFINADGDPVPAEALLDSNDLDENDLDEWAEANGVRRCPRDGDNYREFDSAEGPMMNYRYPISSHVYTSAHAHKIADLALCLVESSDGHVFLALTGGGMDMSWDICDAYVRLGFLPPSHFDLPDLAGMTLNERTALIVAAVERSNEVLANWTQSRQARASRLFETLPSRG